MKESIAERLKEVIEPNKEKENLGHVTIHQARELIRDAGAVLLDVRPPAKVNGDNAQEADIPNAYYMPYPSFYDYADELPVNKSDAIVVACLKGWFANRIMGYLEMLGYSNVYVLDTNIEDLIEVHKAEKELTK
ncbi:rhodanese-like domain-containing protein [Nitratifractor sp.]